MYASVLKQPAPNLSVCTVIEPVYYDFVRKHMVSLEILQLSMTVQQFLGYVDKLLKKYLRHYGRNTAIWRFLLLATVGMCSGSWESQRLYLQFIFASRINIFLSGNDHERSAAPSSEPSGKGYRLIFLFLLSSRNICMIFVAYDTCMRSSWLICDTVRSPTYILFTNELIETEGIIRNALLDNNA